MCTSCVVQFNWRVTAAKRTRKTSCCLHKNFDLELDSKSELQYHVQTRHCPIVHSSVLQPASYWHFPFHAWNEEGLLTRSWLQIHVTEQAVWSFLKIKSIAGHSHRACNSLKPLFSGFKIPYPVESITKFFSHARYVSLTMTMESSVEFVKQLLSTPVNAWNSILTN
jgi:hypothetical protein